MSRPAPRPLTPPLRVALVCDWYPPRVGGIETHVQALAEQLAGAGHRVDVLTTAGGCRPDASAFAAPAVDGDGAPGGVRVRRLALPCFPHWRIPVLVPHTYAAARRALRAGGYDLVHAHASVVSPLAFSAAAAAGHLGVPAVLTHHSMLGGAAGVLAGADRLIGWTRWRVRHTAVSQLVADDVRAAAARAARPRTLALGILPNGIHAEAWAPAAPPEPAPGEFRVASVMRLSERKRPLALLDVADRVRAALPAGVRLRVRVAGDGPERRAVTREIARRGLGDTVELLGLRPRAELRALYAASDAFVLPSVLESFGIAALEARCAGVPVVALRAAGPASFIRHEVEGLLADSDADLARQLLRLAADDGLRAGIARHNRRTRPAETWPAVLARHEAAYAEARRLLRGLALAGDAGRGPAEASAEASAEVRRPARASA